VKIAYLCNSFPEPSESYVAQEIRELRARFVNVLSCSVRRPCAVPADGADLAAETVYLAPFRVSTCMLAVWLCVRRFSRIRELVSRAVRGPEPVARRIRTLGHTLLGAYLAARLRKACPDHIHVHHGYFASWVGMVAARFLNAGFSMTLHGSDLLVRADYLDAKLADCQFCFTVSEFNRHYILKRFPDVGGKILVQHLGIDPEFWKSFNARERSDTFQILTVGRLHAVKNHGFLILACRALKSAGVRVQCLIAGEGEEKPRLERLIAQLQLENDIRLLGQVSRPQLLELYAQADVVVLTSRSEGIPLTLMEAMAMERIVLAPSITGIPELVSHGDTGFLYEPGSIEEFLTQLQVVRHSGVLLKRMRKAARCQVVTNFNGPVNRARFAQTFLDRIQARLKPEGFSVEQQSHENPVLQQI
jgi:glycosyltransferase involved in cell wall biosynthesis